MQSTLGPVLFDLELTDGGTNIAEKRPNMSPSFIYFMGRASRGRADDAGVRGRSPREILFPYYFFLKSSQVLSQVEPG